MFALTATVSYLSAEESPVLRPKEKRPKLDQLQQREDSRLTKMTQLLESVGAVKGSSSQTRLSLMSSTEEGRTHAHISAAAYDPARFRKINTRWYRDEHDKVREKLRQEVAVLEPTRALEVVGSLRQLEEYRRTCGSRILCLDGGGIRGLIQMTVLREIERRTGKRIVDLFDWIVGTSTGGIIALALTYGKGWSLTVRGGLSLMVRDEKFIHAPNRWCSTVGS